MRPRASSVPPRTGLLAGPDGSLPPDELLQAASPAAVRLATAMTAIRWERRRHEQTPLSLAQAQAYPWYLFREYT